MYETIGTFDKQKRDEQFDNLRKTGNRLERQAVRYSEPVVMMNPEVPGEILLDKQGRIRYNSLYVVAYPSN
jgi:hypothetical protein